MKNFFKTILVFICIMNVGNIYGENSINQEREVNLFSEEVALVATIGNDRSFQVIEVSAFGKKYTPLDALRINCLFFNDLKINYIKKKLHKMTNEMLGTIVSKIFDWEYLSNPNNLNYEHKFKLLSDAPLLISERPLFESSKNELSTDLSDLDKIQEYSTRQILEENIWLKEIIQINKLGYLTGTIANLLNIVSKKYDSLVFVEGNSYLHFLLFDKLGANAQRIKYHLTLQWDYILNNFMIVAGQNVDCTRDDNR